MSLHSFEIVDAQVHAWEPNSEAAPWRLEMGSAAGNAAVAAHFEASSMPAARLLDEMDAAGVDAAIVVSPTIYGADTTYAERTVAAAPARLGFVGLVDPVAPALEREVREWRRRPGALAIRLSVYFDHQLESLRSGPARRVLELAERHRVPVCTYPPGYLGAVESVARDFPELQLVVDHLGLPQPPVLVEPDADRFAQLPLLLRLAAYPNVAVKATGVPSLAAAGFPFRDVWEPLERVVEAFGPERVMWGTDFTRVAELVSYRDSVEYLREADFLSRDEKALLFGGALRRVFRWPAA